MHGIAPTIRRAVEQDARPCGQVLWHAFSAVAARFGIPAQFPSQGAASLVARLLIADPSVSAWVAEAGGAVVGCVFMTADGPVRGIGPIAVDPAAEGAGIARALMRSALDEAGEGTPIRLVQDVCNARSLALFVSMGFDVKEPLLLMRGRIVGSHTPSVGVRKMLASDREECASLHGLVHGFRRAGTEAAAASGRGYVIERDGVLRGYVADPTHWERNHGVAETEAVMQSLLAGVCSGNAMPIALLVPMRQAGLLRWCQEAGLRGVKAMTLLARGVYRNPGGAWVPSVLF